jgi:RNA polymerase sigma-70 factor, ECF subfamily
MGDSRTRRAIELLYRERFARFEQVARAIAGDRELAREAVQDGFADALKAVGQFDRRGPLEAWVWRCVVNRAKRARRPSLELLGDPPEPFNVNGSGNGAGTELRARVAALPERQRLAVFLRYCADLDYASIAEALEVEVGTVSATLSQAHRNLRAELVKEAR